MNGEVMRRGKKMNKDKCENCGHLLLPDKNSRLATCLSKHKNMMYFSNCMYDLETLIIYNPDKFGCIYWVDKGENDV